MKKFFKKIAGNVKTNMQCTVNKVFVSLCIGGIACSIAMIAFGCMS